MSVPYFESPLVFFDQEKFRRDLAERDDLISVFKSAINAADKRFEHLFWEGSDVRSLVSERALFIDCILHYAWHRFDWSDQCGLVAVGGYGRQELHPHSDIDILILFQNDDLDADKNSIESFIMLLWDIGLEIGHSVRTLEECRTLAADDITIVTNLMECRMIVGPAHFAQRLKQEVAPEKIWPAVEFFLGKLDEQNKRHDKFNFTEYNLEPNVKNAPGGLRDIQTISWVIKRFFGVETLAELEGQDFISARELAVLNGGQEFLWRVRYGLHLLAGRAEERLLFNYQTELASKFGYNNSEKRLAVEQFMHWYYRVVLSLRELNDVLLQYLYEVAVLNKKARQITPINDRFQLNNSFIEVTHPEVFTEHPSALLEVFVLMGRDPNIEGVRASTIRLIRHNRELINDDYRSKPLHKRLFLELMRSPFDLFGVLRRMKRYGILGRYLPEFGQITGQMQHDLFHIYTVDAHTLQVIKNIRDFAREPAREKFPIAYSVYRHLRKPELLVLAGLFHDIGKGRGGDHSVLGARDLQSFCKSHNISASDTSLVVWLVKQHLTMSVISQKQDLNDPDVIHRFALEVGSQEYLDYLYTLTVADMNGTNPNIWNSWRASLLRQLYMDTKRLLRRGLENRADRQDIIEETQQQALQKLSDKGILAERAKALWADIDDDYFLRETHHDIAWQTEAVIDAGEPDITVEFQHDYSFHEDGATQIFIRAKHRANVFATAASTLDHFNLNIQEARIYGAPNGTTISHYYVLDNEDHSIEHNQELLNKVRAGLMAELALQTDDSGSIHRRTPRALKHFRIPTQTLLYNELASGQTILEVISPDRPGLLARIGSIFLDLGVYLNSAKISTLGERVEDVFAITSRTGEPIRDPDLCAELQEQIRHQLDKQTQAQDSKALA